MKYWLIIIACLWSFSSDAQIESELRAEWRSSKKIKLDVLGIGAQFPTLLFGLEYPLKDQSFAVEHELGPIFNSSTQSDDFENTSGLYTSHTLLLYGDKRDYVIGIGAHYRLLDITGLTACAGDDDDFGQCAYFQLLDEEPVRVQRIAPYLRLRRMTYLRNSVTFSFGVDIGRYFQRIDSDAIASDSFTVETRALGPDLAKGSGIYFRAHAHFIIKI